MLRQVLSDQVGQRKHLAYYAPQTVYQVRIQRLPFGLMYTPEFLQRAMIATMFQETVKCIVGDSYCGARI